MYLQIREYLLERIRAGEWSAGAPIPSENELCERFHVSRITVKQALDALVEKGTVYRIQGKGTFISATSEGEKPIFSPTGTEAAEAVSPLRSQVPEVRLIGYAAPRLNNMYMCNILGGIEGAAAEAGFRLVFARTHDDQALEEKVLADMIQCGVSGIIVYPVEGELYNEYILKLILDRFPLVVVDRYLRGIETDAVCSDNVLGGWQAASHLLELGHRSIAFVSHSHQGTSSVEDRIAGYEKAMREADVPVDYSHRLLSLKSLQPSNTEDIRDFLRSHPEITAVIAVNSYIGGQVLQAAERLGLAVPRELSVVLFDNRDPLSVVPTYIRQDESEMPLEAMRLLLDTIADPHSRRTRIEIPTTLVAGGTSGPAPQR
jgi:DNA-binding LacI/PurR family transcriptional regulator